MSPPNPNLADVNARRAAIAGERAEIAARDQILAAEDNELAIAARVLERIALSQSQPTAEQMAAELTARLEASAAASKAQTEAILRQQAQTSWDEFKAQHKITDKTSIEETISICLLASRLEWHTSNELQDWLSKIRGRDVPMSSISPTLSIMKSKGAIVRDGLKVALTARVGAKPQSQSGELSLTP